jgi:hypothetical protein
VNTLAVTEGAAPTTTVGVSVGPGSSTLVVTVQGHAVMVSVVGAVTVMGFWLTTMTVGVGQKVISVSTTVVVVVKWQSWNLVHGGGGGGGLCVVVGGGWLCVLVVLVVVG